MWNIFCHHPQHFLCGGLRKGNGMQELRVIFGLVKGMHQWSLSEFSSQVFFGTLVLLSSHTSTETFSLTHCALQTLHCFPSTISPQSRPGLLLQSLRCGFRLKLDRTARNGYSMYLRVSSHSRFMSHTKQIPANKPRRREHISLRLFERGKNVPWNPDADDNLIRQ